MQNKDTKTNVETKQELINCREQLITTLSSCTRRNERCTLHLKGLRWIGNLCMI